MQILLRLVAAELVILIFRWRSRTLLGDRRRDDGFWGDVLIHAARDAFFVARQKRFEQLFMRFHSGLHRLACGVAFETDEGVDSDA